MWYLVELISRFHALGIIIIICSFLDWLNFAWKRTKKKREKDFRKCLPKPNIASGTYPGIWDRGGDGMKVVHKLKKVLKNVYAR